MKRGKRFKKKTKGSRYAKLSLFQVNAITKGTDAQAEVTVKLEQDNKSYVGKGADLDTLVASAKAYLHSLNKIYILFGCKLYTIRKIPKFPY